MRYSGRRGRGPRPRRSLVVIAGAGALSEIGLPSKVGRPKATTHLQERARYARQADSRCQRALKRRLTVWVDKSIYQPYSYQPSSDRS